MKAKSILSFLLLMVAGMQTAWAQPGVVIWKDGHHEVVNIQEVDSLMFSEDVKCYIPSDYVDLGLPSGTLWATCNIGAESPEESGGYFAWGETEVKEVYDWNTYRFCKGGQASLTKYNTSNTYGQVDDLEELEPEDDAATVLWGSDWQMPTQAQIEELVDGENTNTERTRENGVYGVRITSKANGNSIFLPAAGLSTGNDGGYYYSRTLYSQLPGLAAALGFNTSGGGVYVSYSIRSHGLTIRPVHKKVFAPTYVDLGLPSGTLWATCNIGAESPEEYGDYFAWGEVQPKERYWWNTYSLCDGKSDAMNKYCTKSDYGTIDGRQVLRAEDDAAAFNWGSDWQIPSDEQFNELANSEYTTRTEATVNGVFGLMVTSKVNGNSIFLPAAGEMSLSNPLKAGSYCRYWARPVWTSYPNEAWSLFYGDGGYSVRPHERCYGMSVRPVRKQAFVPEHVDLGLPSHTLWATCNVGAECPEEYGDYFAWGEVQPKEEYTDESYIHWNGSYEAITKYCTSSKYGTVDNMVELLPEDDAASVNWGTGWQMPSKKQLVELINSDYTTTEWTKQNGIQGLKVTSKANGNSIFLPAAGWISSFCHDGVGDYWTRTLCDGTDPTAYLLLFEESKTTYTNSSRGVGRTVRPVRIIIN